MEAERKNEASWGCPNPPSRTAIAQMSSALHGTGWSDAEGVKIWDWGDFASSPAPGLSRNI